MRDVIVHGASGFVGKHFVRKLLSNGKKVIVLARNSSKLNFEEGKNNLTILRYESSLKEISSTQFNVIRPVFFELSWHGVYGSERNSAEQMSVNLPLIEESIRLANSLGSYHWVGFGSQAEYGNLQKRIKESDACHPTTLYGAAKLKCSEIAEQRCDEYNMQFSWLRLFSVYGPDDNHTWLIQYLIEEMLANRDVNVTKGEQIWDYLYIDDISEMLLKLKDADGVGIANLGYGKGVQVKYIIEKVKEFTNSKSTLNFGALPYRDDQVMFMEADISKLSNHLNWKPEITIEEGLKRTIEFIQKKQRS